MMAVTKVNLLKAISDTSNFSKQESSDVVESLLEIIKRTLESGEGILITGFGKFYVRDKKERRGRNPQTGDDMMMDARRVVMFKSSNILKGRINGEG